MKWWFGGCPPLLTYELIPLCALICDCTATVAHRAIRLSGVSPGAPLLALFEKGPCRTADTQVIPQCPYASSSHPTSSAAPSFFQVPTDPVLRLVSIAAISARDTLAFFASCS